MAQRTSIERPAPHALTSALADAAAFDPSGLAPIAGLRAAVGLTAVLAVGLATTGPAGAVVAASGALVAGIVSVTGGVRPPLVTMLLTALAEACSIFVGSATGNVAVLHLAILAVWCFGGALLVALNSGATVVGLQAIVGVVVFGRFPEAPVGAARLAGLALAGAAFQILLTAVVRWPEALRAQRAQLAVVFAQLAVLARGAPDASGLPSAEAVDAAEEVLSGNSLLARDDGQSLRGVLDEARRVRLALLSLSGLRRRITDHAAAAAVDDSLDDIAAALDSVAAALTGSGAAVAARLRVQSEALSARARQLARAGEQFALTSPAAGVVASIAGQLRAVQSLLDEIQGSGRARLRVPRRRRNRGGLRGRIRSDAAQLRANLSPRSAALRHATRMAVLVPAAAIAAQQSPLVRSYWIPLTVALVLRPDFAGTFTRGAARTLGTAVGVAITGIAIATLHPGQVTSIVLIGVLAWGTYALFVASFAAAIACITGIVVLLLGLITPDTVGTAVDRLLDTLIGGAIAMAAYVVWPTWSAGEARAAVSDLISALSAYLRAVLGIISGAATDAGALAPLARDARLARSNANAVVDRSLREPSRHRVDQEQTAGVLAALRRVSEAVHLLRTQAAEPRRAALPAAIPLTDAFTVSMATLASTLRGEDGPRALPPLRELHDRLEFEEEGEGRTVAGLVVTETDEIVDALDTIGHLLDLDVAGAR